MQRPVSISSLRPSGRKKWVWAPARKMRWLPVASQTLCLSCPAFPALLCPALLCKAPPGYYANSILEFFSKTGYCVSPTVDAMSCGAGGTGIFSAIGWILFACAIFPASIIGDLLHFIARLFGVPSGGQFAGNLLPWQRIGQRKLLCPLIFALTDSCCVPRHLRSVFAYGML